MDVHVIEGLGDRTLALGGEDFGSGRALAIHGVTASLRPTLTGEGWDAAEESLRKATALAPERLTPKVDLALYVLRPQGRDAELRALLQEVLDHPLVDDDPNRPENERKRRAATRWASRARIDGEAVCVPMQATETGERLSGRPAPS